MKKGRRMVIWFAAAISGFICLWWLFPHATQATTFPMSPRWVEFRLSPLGQNGTDVNDGFIVWSDYAGDPYDGPLQETCLSDYPDPFSPLAPSPRAAICQYDVTTGEITMLRGVDSFNYFPRLADDWIVFRHGFTLPDIIAVNRTTGEEQILNNTIAIYPFDAPHNLDQQVVVVSGFLFSGERGIVAYDLTSQEISVIRHSDTAHPNYADIAYPYVVWHEIGPTGGMDVMGYNLTTQTTFTISVQMPHEGYARIEGTTVVWEREGDIVGYDIAAATPFTITQDAYQQREPTISDRWIVWQDDRHGQWEIYAYDRSSGQTYRVTNHPLDDQHPAVAGHIITWERSSNVPQGVYAARLMTYFSFLPYATHSKSPTPHPTTPDSS